MLLLQERRVGFWFGLSLAIAVYFGLLYLPYAFARDFVVQDDARHYVFWMQRFAEPGLFPSDLIADYYQAVTPTGYAALFRGLAAIGIAPTIAIKILPLFLGLVTTGYAFWMSLELFSVPAGAFLSTLILNQALWLRHDLVAAAPRAFVYPLFFAFLYYLLKGRLLPCLGAIALQGLFYPSSALVAVGTLTAGLVSYRNGSIRLTKHRSAYRFWVAGSVVALAVLLIYTPELSKFGPIVTLDQAKIMPEFGPSGRTEFFVNNPLQFWLTGDSGLHPPVYPPLIWLSVALPLLLKWRLPLTRYVFSKVSILGQILVASVGLFLLAHIVLLRLYFPGRYTEHSLIMIMALATGIALTVLLEAGTRWLRQRRTGLLLPQRLGLGLVGLFLLASLIVPEIPPVVASAYDLIPGKAPAVYAFLQQQPKTTLTASLSEEANNLPIFAQRPILVGREYALPYHVKYYRQIRQRVTDLIRAQYSSDPLAVRQLIEQYGIDYVLLDSQAFTPEYLASNAWLQQFQPATREALERLKQGQVPLLQRQASGCTAVETQDLTLVDAQCLLTALNNLGNATP